MEIKENPTSIVYMIDDRTGPLVKVQRWIEDQSSPMDPSERSLCREGMYVKAIGNIKTFNNQKTITAFSVRPVTDFNEVTYHLSDAMMSHLAATRALPVVSMILMYCMLGSEYNCPSMTLYSRFFLNNRHFSSRITREGWI